MLKIYFKLAIRNILKNKMHSAISLTSLVLAITFFLLIIIWVRDELSYDTGYKDAKRIYRVETDFSRKDGNSSANPTVGWPVGRALATQFPEIEELTYFSSWHAQTAIGTNKFYEKGFRADDHFFDVLQYEFTEGSASHALLAPFSMVISEELKEKYFGKQQAVGRTMMVDDTIPYKITAVFRQPAVKTHLRFDMVSSFSSLAALHPQDIANEYASGWFDVNVYNYVKLVKGANVASLNSKIRDLVLRDGKSQVEATGMSCTLSLRPLDEIYLKSGMPTAGGASGNMAMVRLFTLIGLFIVVIACLNFINLTTAKSMERAKEIGVKKVLGGSRATLIAQFMTESAVMCTVAFLISLGIVLGLLTRFNAFTGKDLNLLAVLSPGNLLTLLVILVLLIPLAGFYPALVLASYKAIVVLKGKFSQSQSGNLLRKILVVVQFGISVTFILGSVIIWKQMSFIQQQDLGFDKDKVLILNLSRVPYKLVGAQTTSFFNALSEKPEISGATACSAVPGETGWAGQFAYPEGRSKEDGAIVEYIPVDNAYIKTLGLKVLSGRAFDKSRKVDQDNNLVINEAAVRTFGWKNAADAIGKKLSTSGKNGEVVGVLKDYHQHGLQESIAPVVLGIGSMVQVYAVRYQGNDASQALATIDQAWKKTFPGYNMDHSFLDKEFQAQYVKEDSFKTLFGLASFLSIAIACVGLFGLALFTAQRRVKEIGVRKVLGASVANITAMLSKDFIRLVLIGIVAACPLAWIIMEQWLQGFAYRTVISWWIFPLAGLAAVVIAVATVSFQAWKAALASPAKSLKAE